MVNQVFDTNIPIVNPDGTPTPEFEEVFNRALTSGDSATLDTESLDRQVNYPRPRVGKAEIETLEAQIPRVAPSQANNKAEIEALQVQISPALRQLLGPIKARLDALEAMG